MGRTLCVAALFAATAGAAAAAGCAPRPADRFDRACASRCALPPGLDLGRLPAEERTYYAERAVLCADFECGRLSAVEYRKRLADLRYTELGAVAERTPADVAPSPSIPKLWASAVFSFSSEFEAERWSAMNALGPPDTYPNYGNIPTAWSPRTTDDAIEYIELGFKGEDLHVSGIDIYETHNPGAVMRVEVLGPGDARAVVYDVPAHPMTGIPAFVRRITFRCTSFPVRAVRITLDSPAVPGWNEIDAVAVYPCAEERAAPTGKVWTDG